MCIYRTVLRQWLQSATVNKHSNCRGHIDKVEEEEGEEKWAGVDNYYEHFLQNSDDKFQYLTEQRRVVHATRTDMNAYIHTHIRKYMYKCICRNGKIITIITKNYLSTNTAIAAEEAAEEASRGGKRQQIQIRATHQIKRYETLLQKRSAQNAVIKFVTVAIPIVVVVVSSFVQIPVLDRVACCCRYRCKEIQIHHHRRRRIEFN